MREWLTSNGSINECPLQETVLAYLFQITNDSVFTPFMFFFAAKANERKTVTEVETELIEDMWPVIRGDIFHFTTFSFIDTIITIITMVRSRISSRQSG